MAIAKFYDVKLRTSVETEVTEKVIYSGEKGTRYAFRGKTGDGRNLTTFTSKVKFDAVDAPTITK